MKGRENSTLHFKFLKHKVKSIFLLGWGGGGSMMEVPFHKSYKPSLKSFTVKDNHIGSVVIEILRYTHTQKAC